MGSLKQAWSPVLLRPNRSAVLFHFQDAEDHVLTLAARVWDQVAMSGVADVHRGQEKTGETRLTITVETPSKRVLDFSRVLRFQLVPCQTQSSFHVLAFSDLGPVDL